jgi:hypothetical protein
MPGVWRRYQETAPRQRRSLASRHSRCSTCSSTSLARYSCDPVGRLGAAHPAASGDATPTPPARRRPIGRPILTSSVLASTTAFPCRASPLAPLLGRAPGTQRPRAHGWSGDDPPVRRPRCLRSLSRPGDRVRRPRQPHWSCSLDRQTAPSGASWSLCLMLPLDRSLSDGFTLLLAGSATAPGCGFQLGLLTPGNGRLCWLYAPRNQGNRVEG